MGPPGAISLGMLGGNTGWGVVYASLAWYEGWLELDASQGLAFPFAEAGEIKQPLGRLTVPGELVDLRFVYRIRTKSVGRFQSARCQPIDD